ncbi:uncharacterized protein LOC123310596 isoform X2 [Coccinella septempunctata]|uniref:uncharacterized protein LOC123310596 isoform X2 n=1 Tax=Coccinella septempunctata TaxID=41139 RepID=UPI001D0903DD|nr:uncharacterized protein LOC123310596 isoform X2 [Coccinella septempunctata]
MVVACIQKSECIKTSWTRGENILSKNEIQAIPTTESPELTTVMDGKKIQEAVEHAAESEAIIIENANFLTSQSESTWNKSRIDLNVKKIPIIFIQKLHPQELLRPVQQKWKEINDLLSYPFHPNYGGLILLHPQHIWNKLKEKGNFFLGGAHNSIFGTAHSPPEYPFPYRRAEKNLLIP